MSIVRIGAIAVGAALVSPIFVPQSVNAATTTYTSSATFAAQLGTSVTDNYQNPGYVFTQSNAAMSAVLGETKYTSTGFSDLNIVSGDPADHYYCAGCNGSFLLNFQSTSVGGAQGVFGAGFNFANLGDSNGGGIQYSAFVTFGDGSTQNYLLPLTSNFPNAGEFFGITSDLLIASIALGLPDGDTTTDGNFAIDNLKIGSAASLETPIPAALPLFASGLGFLGLAGWRRKRKVVAA